MRSAASIERSETARNAGVQTKAIFGASQAKNRSGSKKLWRQNRIFLARRTGVSGLDWLGARAEAADAADAEACASGVASGAVTGDWTRPCSTATSRNWSTS